MKDIEAAAQEVMARGESARRRGRDPVNRPMVRNWLEALGDENPVYADVAPPAMAQVWTMFGLHGKRPDDDPLGVMVSVLDEAGYTSVVATNCEQTYHRYLRYDEEVSVASTLESVIGPKRTALGEGWFVTTRSTWYVDDEPVAEMRFRVLKFQPKPAPPPVAPVIRPSVNRDTAFFWEGTALGELRIQQCGGCGALRHPPGPMCPHCHETKPKHVVVSGLGEVYSYVVHHHPPVPGHTLPFVIALVELSGPPASGLTSTEAPASNEPGGSARRSEDTGLRPANAERSEAMSLEGVRLLAELVDVAPDEVHVGLPVRIGFTKVDDELTMPVWRPR